MADIFSACLLIPYSTRAFVSLVSMPVCKPVHSLCLQVVYLHAVQCLKGISRHMHSVTMGPDTLQARISQFEKERIRCSICLHFTTLPFYCQYMFCHFNEKRLQSHNAGGFCMRYRPSLLRECKLEEKSHKCYNVFTCPGIHRGRGPWRFQKPGTCSRSLWGQQFTHGRDNATEKVLSFSSGPFINGLFNPGIQEFFCTGWKERNGY